MGWPMAAHQARHAQALVWNRTAHKAKAHAEQFGSKAVTLSEAFQTSLIVSCLPTSAEVSQLIEQFLEQTSEQSGQSGQSGQTLGQEPQTPRFWVDCTSGHPAIAQQQREQLLQRNVHFIDAPVSGGTSGAETGTLTVMLGGPSQEIEQIKPRLAFAAKLVHVGPTGAGFAVKAINNTLLASQLVAIAEGLATLGRMDVNLEAALDVINASSGRSNASENLAPQRILTREFPVTFQLGLLAKDTRIATDVVQATKSSAPLLAQSGALTQAAMHYLGPEVDHSALVQLIELMNQQVIK